MNTTEERPEQTDSPDAGQPEQGHWAVLGELIAFQFKLALDGVRDLLLSPVSIIAALAGMLSSSSDPGRHLRKVMSFGRRSDRFINLFGEFDDSPSHRSDDYLRKIEAILQEEYRKSGVVTDLKNSTDQLFHHLHARHVREHQEPPHQDP
ncbi:MAG: hypothetical protein KDI36_05425 [Pseudomonadales bacterium]|nr:hypothetical protein [Pseudomonadales bacterium]